jgi:hypothetical protein
MKIKSQRKRVTQYSYASYYEWNDCPGAGYSFDCDEKGNLLPFKSETAQKNYEKCRTGEYDVRFVGVQKYEHSYTEPAIGLCEDCGEEVVLDGFTCTCDRCGADYNSFGQRLASREQWGEETGESLADILAVDSERGVYYE